MAYVVTSCFWQVIDHWQTLIAGGIAGLAGLAAYTGALRAARRQVKAANKQTAVVERQNAALKLVEQHRIAGEQLMVARLLHASLELLSKDIADASDSYKSPREDEIIAAGDANAIRDRIKKPASFSVLMERIIRISGDFWTRVWCSIFRPRFDRRLPYGADEAGAQATAQSERIKA